MLKRLALLGALLLAGTAALAQTQPADTTNASVSITTGNTFQTVLAAGVRRSITIENNNTNSDNCWVHVDASAVTKANSILLTPGGSYTRYYPYIPAGAIQATCTTTADTLYVDYQ